MTQSDKPSQQTPHNHLPLIEEPTPIDVKGWSQKALVLILCAISFYAGGRAHESRMVNNCVASGGEMVERGDMLMCQSR